MSEKQTVHALLHGLPLCMFSKDIPAKWPKGHVWTRVEDIKSINCKKCKERARKINN